MQEILTTEQIKTLYPDQWVLVGNPRLREDNFTGALIDMLLSGVPLYSSKDKREIAYKIKDLKREFQDTACVWTGEMPTNRRFFL
jgi:ERCC4-type nuclease